MNSLARSPLAFSALVLSVFAAEGCASSKYGRVPVLRSPAGAQASVSYPEVRTTDLATWKSLGVQVVTVDGQKVLASVSKEYGTSKDSLKGTTEIVNGTIVRKINEAFQAAGAKPASQPKLTQSIDGSKLYGLALCDAQCGGEAFDAVLQSIDAAEQKRRTKASNDKAAKSLRKRFGDLDPNAWTGRGPWWVDFSADYVPYVDDERVVIGVGVSSKGARGFKRTAASDRSRVEVSKFVAAQAGAEWTEGVRLQGAVVMTVFETADTTFALTVCDQSCLEKTAKANGWTLPAVATTKFVR